MRGILQFISSFIRSSIRLEHPYENPVDRYRAQLLIILMDILIVFALLFMGVSILGFNEDPENARVRLIGGILFLVAMPYAISIIQRGGLRLASRLFVTLLTGMVIAADFLTTDHQQISTMLPIVLGSILLTWAETIFIALLMLGLTFYHIITAPDFSWQTVTPTTLIAVTFIYTFITSLMLATHEWLIRAATRFQNEISRLRQITFPLLRLNLNTDENTYINQAIESIAANLGFPTVRVYLTDGDQGALRLVQSGLTVEQNAKLLVDPGSGFASALQTHEPLFIDQNSTAAERAHFLPGTTSGALLPLMYREQVIGILDIQSVGDRTIEASKRELLNVIALNLATTIGNTRTLNGIQSEAKQQQDIIMRQRNRLRQIEQTEQQAIVTAWTDYLDQRDQRIIGFDVNEMSMQLIPTDYLPDHMRMALERNDVATYEEDNQQHVTLPIQLRGQTLGAASFSMPSNRPITRRQIEIMRNVIQRLALALDNKRLFEQSQSQAQRESKANEIASMLLSSTDMDTVLRLAATNFNDALGAIQTHIELFSEAAVPTQEEHA
jgi:K+-sensing histidine kinase KdpD